MELKIKYSINEVVENLVNLAIRDVIVPKNAEYKFKFHVKNKYDYEVQEFDYLEIELTQNDSSIDESIEVDF